MYQEMYDGIVDLLRVGHAEDLKHMRPDEYPHVAQVLNLLFDINIDGIKRIKKLESKGLAPIYMVLADPINNGTVNANQLLSYIMVDGEPAWVVMFNFSMLVSKNVETELFGLAAGIKSLCRIPMMTDTIRSQFASFDAIGTIQYYAPLFIACKLLHRYYPKTDIASIKEAVRSMYKSTADPDASTIVDATIISTINLLGEFDISDLLDNSYFLGTSGNMMYKDIWFTDAEDDMDDTDADITDEDDREEAEAAYQGYNTENNCDVSESPDTKYEMVRINGVSLLYSQYGLHPEGFYCYNIIHTDNNEDEWVGIVSETSAIPQNSYAGLALSPTDLNIDDSTMIKINTLERTGTYFDIHTFKNLVNKDNE